MAVNYMNQTELAARWGVSPRTLERWRSSGEGPAFIKLGGRIMYRLDDVEAYEDHQRRFTAETRAEEGS